MRGSETDIAHSRASMMPSASGGHDNSCERSRYIPSLRFPCCLHAREATSSGALAQTRPIATMRQYVVCFLVSHLINYIFKWFISSCKRSRNLAAKVIIFSGYFYHSWKRLSCFAIFSENTSNKYLLMINPFLKVFEGSGKIKALLLSIARHVDSLYLCTQNF